MIAFTQPVLGHMSGLQVRVWWAGCMLTAALNLASIVAIGSGLSEGRLHADTVDHTHTSVGGKPYRSDTAGVEGGRGTTVV